MLRGLRDLEKDSLMATEGDIGVIVSSLFDDQHCAGARLELAVVRETSTPWL